MTRQKLAMSGKRIGTQAIGLVAVMIVTACQGSGPAAQAPVPGDTKFVSAPVDQGDGWLNYFVRDGEPEEDDPAEVGPDATIQREIEEADLVKVDGNTLYALNTYRGLYLVDITNPDQPVIQGRLEVYGYPLVMYVRGNRIYIVLSNYFRVWRAESGGDVEIGSAVVTVDISIPESPVELSRFWFPGYVTDTRVVGDVLYTVSNRYSWFGYYYPSDDWEDTTHITSISIADPLDIHQVDTLVFTRAGDGDNHTHATPDAIWVAANGDLGNSYECEITYVDISDPSGKLALGAAIAVPGIVRDRWQMDTHNGVFRVITQDSGWDGGEPQIHTFQVHSPTRISKLAELRLQLPRPEALTVARFDGDRAYLATYERADPLLVVDLSDPAAPVQTGALEMPGWLDHLVPRGDRLVALGHDDSDGITTLALSLFDVANPYQPALIQRISAEAGGGFITDESGNYDKVFKVIDSEGLILLPFLHCPQDDYWRCTGGVQLVDYGPDSLVKRGLVTHAGYVRRALTANNRLLTLSDQRLQVLDITDRDHPALTADLVLSRWVTQLAVVGDHPVHLVGDWYSGETHLLVLPPDAPDLGTPIAEVAIDAPYARLFTHGTHIFVLHRERENPDLAETPRLLLTPVDLTDPAQPVIGTPLVFDEPFDYYGYSYGWYWWGGWGYPSVDEVVQVNGSTLVFHAVRRWSWCSDCESDKLMVVDLSTPDRPRISWETELQNRDRVLGLQVVASEVRFSHYNFIQQTDPRGRPLAAYFVNRIDVSDPDHPMLYAPVNVPGVLIGSDPQRGVIYTEDFQWSADSFRLDRSVNTVALGSGTAVLRGRLALPEDAARLLISGDHAWTVRNRWWWDEVNDSYFADSSLQGVDLSNMYFPSLTAETLLPLSDASLLGVESGRAIIGTHWYISGLMLYDVRSGDPVFQRHVRTDGWLGDLSRCGNDLCVATGPWGVRTLSFD